MDLSFKRDDDERDSDNDKDEESDDGVGSKQNYQGGAAVGAGGGGGGGRSRRKPAATQWVNPSNWSGEEPAAKPESMTINGVCVVNSGAFSHPDDDKMEDD